MTRRAAFLLCVSSLVALGQATPATNNDDRIYDEVRRRLANDSDVKGAGIDVTVANGNVTLKGQVRTDKAKAKATALCKKVKGVLNVDNQLRLFGVN